MCPLPHRLKEDLDSTTSHLPYLSMGNFVCLQVRFMTRSDVGYLHWSWEQMERDRLPQVESLYF